MSINFWKKAVSLVSSFALLFNSLFAPLYVYAQEETATPEPTPVAEESVSPSPEPTIAPAEGPSLSPEVSPSPEVTVAPEETVTPPAPASEEVLPVETTNENAQPQAPPVDSPEPTAEAVSITPVQPIEEGNLSTTIVQEGEAFPITVQNYDGYTVTTDKLDYAPTDTAIITGTSFTSGETYTLTVSSDDPPATSTSASVTADENGQFVYAYQLDGIYRPDYKVELKDLTENIVATTTFTDSTPALNITRSGSGGGTVTSDDGFINCVVAGGGTSGTCSHTYASDNPGVILTATADTSSTFGGWTGGGACAGTGTCTPSGLTGTNTVTVEAIFNADVTPPIVTSSKTQDIDGDGHLDAIELTFSENIDDDQLNEGDPDGWDVVGAGGESIGTGDTTNDNILVLSFSEGPTPDTANRPTVTYTPSGGPISTHDLAGNELEEYEGVPDDGALPVLLSAFTRDSDLDGQIDGIELTFSEDIDDSMLNEGTADGWDVDSYDGEAISTGETEDDNILLLAFDESGSADTATTPTVSYAEGGGDVSTHDSAGNELAGDSWATSDGAAPTSSISGPEEGFITNDPIWISGSSTDTDILSDGDTVDSVQLFYRESVSEGEENEWIEIDTVENTEGYDPFGWIFEWAPPNDGTFDIKAEATDTAGNTELSPQVNDITYDTTNPSGNWEAPPADTDVNGTVTLEVSASDATAGVKEVEFLYQRNDGVDDFHSIAIDNTNTYSTDWDTTGLALDDYTLRAIIRDNAGNETTIDQVNGVSAVVSEESGASSTYGSATITWTTDRSTSSRVIYDTVSHGTLGDAPNYGYAFSTGTTDTSPKVTSHSVTVTGLSNGITYYYRTVSEGSPVTVGEENSFQTLSTAGAPAPSAGGGAVAGVSTTAFFAPLTSFLTPTPVSAEEEVLGQEVESTPTPKPEVKGAETPQGRSWLWLLLVPVILGLGYYYYNKKSK